jgi:hypothetical protein
VVVVAAVLTAAVLVAIAFGTAAVWGRIASSREPRSFRCRVSPHPWARWRGRARWCLFAPRAHWVHDALVLRSGFLRLGVTAFPACIAPGTQVEELARREARRLGGRPLALLLRLEEGGTLEVAAPADCRELLVGPFLAAAVAGLPAAPREEGSR